MDGQTVGLVGLGLMGSAMARRLIQRGFTVVGFDIVPDRMKAAVVDGVRPATSPGDLATQAGTIILSVTSTRDVIEVVAGDNGLCAPARIGANVVVDTSTTEIGATHEIAAHLRDRKGVPFVDAPVSGGPAACETGTLAIMAGGSIGGFAAAEAVLKHLGTTTHMGETGAGQATKLINQTLVLNNFVVIAEALRLAEAYGVDAKKVPTALASGHAGSNLLPVLFERMIARDWTPTGYARQILKDLEMVGAAAKAEGLATPMTAQATTMFRMLVGGGRGEEDGAAVLELLPEAKAQTAATPEDQS